MNDKLISLQYLRGLAATLVVFHHALATDLTIAHGAWGKVGSWGVDIFFVISGFIIWRSAQGRPFSARGFLFRRVVRIFPLWWLALSSWIVARLIAEGGHLHSDLSLETAIYSFFLIPHYNLAEPEKILPILVPGWTLQLEIFFYGLFLVAFSVFPKHATLWLIAIMISLVSLGTIIHSQNPVMQTYTSALLLEFVAGVFIATQFHRLRDIPIWLSLMTILIVLFFVLSIHHEEPAWRRAIVMGAPAAIFVTGVLSLEKHLRRRPIALFENVGNCSYSLYLFHPIFLGVAVVAWKTFHFSNSFFIVMFVFVPAVLLLSIGAAYVIYRVAEQPLLRSCNKLLRMFDLVSDKKYASQRSSGVEEAKS